MRSKIGITGMEHLSWRDFDEKSFEHQSARTMDKFTRSMIAVAGKLYKDTHAAEIPPHRLGVTVATSTGPYESIRNTQTILSEKGYIGINPSLFPNIMLSTSLSHVAATLNCRGPSIALYLDGDRHRITRYGIMQISAGRCDGMLALYADDGKECFGLFLESETSAEKRGQKIKLYI